MKNPSIIALIVTFNPDERLLLSIGNLKDVVSHIVIVDNNSSDENFIKSLNDQIERALTILNLSENFGIAYALNHGIKYILERFSVDYILILDQDTILIEKNLGKLIHDVEKCWSNVGIISLGDRKIDKKNYFREAKYVITSGSLIKREVLTKVRFRDEFFMDQVDFDFDFNVIKLGYSIISVTGHLIDHRLGIKLGRITYEPPIRFYYIVRNSTVLLLERKLPLSLYLFQIINWSKALILYDGLLKYIRVLSIGFFDGLKKNLGKKEKNF
ncbi:MAG: glycosyltransferase [Thermoplasmata archaeon]